MATKTLDVKGGGKLAAALAKIADSVGRGSVSVGFLEGATYPGGDGDEAGLSVAQVAFWNEFGTLPRPTGAGVDSIESGAGLDAIGGTSHGGTPPRPFFRNAIAQNSEGWGGQLGDALKATKMDGKKSLAILGTIVKDNIVKSIVDTVSPPNAPSTIARKGFDKPLIDSGVMQRSVDFVVDA